MFLKIYANVDKKIELALTFNEKTTIICNFVQKS